MKKYMEINDDDLDIKMANTDNEDGTAVIPALIANIPIRKMKQNAGK